MKNEYKYIEYMLNPPNKFEEGQLWKYPAKNLEFVITEVINQKIVRAALLTKVKYLADSNDISLKNDKIAREVFPRERFVLRITDGPVTTYWFQIYAGKVEDTTLKKIKDSLKIKTFEHDEVQKILITELLGSLEPLREEALELYLSSLSEQEEDYNEPIIINLPSPIYDEVEETVLLAASDLSAEEKMLEFWRKERDSNYQTELPLKIPDMIVRISNVDNKYYLIIITDKYKTINKIEITENEEQFFAKENIDIPDTKRIPILINKKFNDEFIYKIKLKVDNNIYTSYFMINYD
ncbi:MAG: hypothetical protein QHH13_05155 [Melioribacter sp.]|uniref:hypothetical protein n=1 Tax=Rosettibacter primus TaxID=3111523 RepID=UPI00247DD0E0|nr:hypothetical protein [Melioribacter sp.]